MVCKVMRKPLVLTIVFVFACGITLSSIMAFAQEDYNIPAWIKNNAAWWSEGQIDDASFVSGITYMIENGIMEISQSNTPVNNMSLDDLYQENQEFREYFENTLSDTVEYARNEQVLSEQIFSLEAQLQAAQNANTGGSSVQKIQDNGNFVVVYIEPNTDMGNYFEQEIKAWGYFEEQAQWLNSSFRLPYDVVIVLAECGVINAFYDPSQKAIFMCYELINDIDALFYQHLNGDPSYIDETNRVIDFIFYHELGHALIGVYELPTTGPEEDAADSFSSYVMADLTGGTDGQDSIYTAATWFWLEHQRQGISNSALWAEHSLNMQRYYNISCFSYGSNPSYNQDLVDNGWLPYERAIRCGGEYTQQKNSWNEILQPFFK